jgi:hypothetical protein
MANFNRTHGNVVLFEKKQKKPRSFILRLENDAKIIALIDVDVVIRRTALAVAMAIAPASPPTSRQNPAKSVGRGSFVCLVALSRSGARSSSTYACRFFFRSYASAGVEWRNISQSLAAITALAAMFGESARARQHAVLIHRGESWRERRKQSRGATTETVAVDRAAVLGTDRGKKRRMDDHRDAESQGEDRMTLNIH